MSGEPQRWSATRKREVVLRVLRGEPLMAVARAVKVPITEVDRWHHRFLEAGRDGLRARPDSWQVRGLREARSTISELKSKIKILEQALQETSGGSNGGAAAIQDEAGQMRGQPGRALTIPPWRSKQSHNRQLHSTMEEE